MNKLDPIENGHFNTKIMNTKENVEYGDGKKRHASQKGFFDVSLFNKK